MTKVKPTEKTLEQFFSEKLAAIHKEDKPVIKTRKDVFSDEHTSVTRESLDYTKYLNELASRVSKNKKPDQPTLFQEFNPKNTIEATTDKINESPQPIIPKTADNDRQQEDPSREIAVYQQIINSLRAELTAYKSKLNAINPKIMQYEQNINSLRAEIVEYRNRMELMVSERNQQSGVDSLRAELAEHRNRVSTTLSRDVPKDEDFSSLGAEISRLKRNLDLIISK
ncbi:MAG: hypothetical protein E6K87_04575 [Thaumarchaeota archaeon]|nr:MAG: hypothetical protein E6K87_04575 [Nitrososphaerota archaeon]